MAAVMVNYEGLMVYKDRRKQASANAMAGLKPGMEHRWRRIDTDSFGKRRMELIWWYASGSPQRNIGTQN